MMFPLLALDFLLLLYFLILHNGKPHRTFFLLLLLFEKCSPQSGCLRSLYVTLGLSLTSFPSCVSALARLALVPVQPQDLKLVFAIFDKVHNEAFPLPPLHPFLLLSPLLCLMTLWPRVGAATANRSFINLLQQEKKQHREREKKKWSLLPVRFGCSCFLCLVSKQQFAAIDFLFLINAEVCEFRNENK